MVVSFPSISICYLIICVMCIAYQSPRRDFFWFIILHPLNYISFFNKSLCWINVYLVGSILSLGITGFNKENVKIPHLTWFEKDVLKVWHYVNTLHRYYLFVFCGMLQVTSKVINVWKNCGKLKKKKRAGKKRIEQQKNKENWTPK